MKRRTKKGVIFVVLLPTKAIKFMLLSCSFSSPPGVWVGLVDGALFHYETPE